VTRWAAFGIFSLALLGLLLASARASQSVVSSAPRQDRWLDGLADGAEPLDVPSTPAPSTTATPAGPRAVEASSSAALLANVVVSQGVFALLLLAGVWLADVPVAALGIAADPLGSGLLGVGVGVGVGVGISLANTAAAGLADAFGADPSERLRALLAPDSARGWLLLLAVVLPVIAGFEELLFRAVLVGAFSAGFGLSPWPLAVLSSVAFAAGHGAQGRLGVVVTGSLGFVLAAAFVLTDSLLVVVVAHYVVNAAEFVVAEGLGWEPFAAE
jgi:membrane protease YdiL (CAAX protease family)